MYMKAPTYTYQIGIFTVERNRDLACDDKALWKNFSPEWQRKALLPKLSHREKPLALVALI